MKIIIAGDGKVGLALTRLLLREDHDIVVIDKNPRVLRANLEQHDVLAVEGNAATMGTLRQAGVEKADLLIAATSTDETNLLCCLTAKKMNPRIHTAARVRNPEYAEQLFAMREELGLSVTVNPDRRAAQEISRVLQYPAFLRRDSFAKGRAEIVELRIDEESPLKGMALHALYAGIGVKVLVCAVVRGGEVTIPGGSYVLQEGDHIYVTAETDKLAYMMKRLGVVTHKIRQVMIVGASHISFYLVKMLLQAGIGVKVIEKDPVRARMMAEQYPAVSVILDDGSSQQVLDREGVAWSDALVTMTGIDEENIVISMYGHASGVHKVVTKVDRLEYSGMFEDLGVGSIVNPKELCSAAIVRYVRAMKQEAGGVLTLYRIADGAAEALEFQVDDGVPWRGVPLKDIPLKSGVLIACIFHQGKTIIPDGNSCFQSGDGVIVVTTSENPFQNMEDIFAERDEQA